jgi:NhaP-type Na+/H+ or K+/H+ antiporter
VLGIAAQWLAWRLGVASILLLLVVGFLAGPVSKRLLGWSLVDTDQLLGDLLVPFVSISVALILYEGGLTLRLAELKEVRAAVWRLVTLGAALTWLLTALAAWLVLDLSPALAVLLGAVLVVTGPTVIVPLLIHIRPSGRIGAILKWEGIVIDPIGAMLAVLVFEAILLPTLGQAAPHVAMNLIRTIVIGGSFGFVAGMALALGRGRLHGRPLAPAGVRAAGGGGDGDHPGQPASRRRQAHRRVQGEPAGPAHLEPLRPAGGPRADRRLRRHRLERPGVPGAARARGAAGQRLA